MLRAGIVGWGQWGRHLGRAVAANGSWDLRAIADLRDDRLANALQSHPHVAVHSTAEPVWSDSALDAVVIATPAVTHFDLALAALESGKHVLVEKPMTQTSVEARTLVAEAARRGLVLMVDHTYLFSQPVRAMRALIEAGKVGSPLRCESSRLNLVQCPGNSWAFGRRCIPPGGVAPPSHMPNILGRRALPAGRIDALGAPAISWTLH